MNRALKSIDFYQAVPNQLSQGTVSGACITVATVTSLIILIYGAIYQSMSPSFHSDMIVDQKHLQQKMKVNIDIQFPSYPCSLLSLDIENVLRVHEVNIGDTIKKFDFQNKTQYIDTHSRDERKSRIIQGLKNGKGCRMTGFFYIDPVPGNFHFSSHAYNPIMQQIIQDGTLGQLHKKIDLSHRINYLYFGQTQEHGPFQNFQSRKQIYQLFLGISYMYFLDIVQTNTYNKVKDTNRVAYQYTARMNEVILSSAPTVLFKYETNPISYLLIKQYKEWHILFVKLVGIIGGIFTVATIADSLIHSSIRFLVEKHRLGKLR